MSYFRSLLRSTTLLYLCLGGLFIVSAFQARRTLEAGNRLFRNGDVLGAAEVYASEAGRTPEGLIASYNLGTALQTLGSPQAEQHLLRGADARNDEVAHRAHYNLGVGYLQQVDPEADPHSAVLLLSEAVRHNRAALRLDPTDAQARWNLAIALDMYRELPEVVEEAPVEPRGEAEAAEDDPDQPPAQAAAGGAGQEGEPPTGQDDPGDPGGPRQGAAEALARGDPGALPLDVVQQMLDAQLDDREQLIRGILWSQRPVRDGASGGGASPGGSW